MSKFSLAQIFQNNCVLQRDKDINIFGTATPGAVIYIEIADEAGNILSKGSCLADNDSFCCTLPPISTARNLTVTVKCCDEVITLSNVAMGDIWLATGQSNMEFFLKYERDWETVKNYEKNPDIHMYSVPQIIYEGQIREVPGFGIWMQDGDDGYENFSAPGYAFAREIQPVIDAPIAIVGCNVGGSTASSWVPREVLDTPELNYYLTEYEAECAKYTKEEMDRISLEASKFETGPEHSKAFEPLLYGQDWEWQLKYMEEHKGEPFVPMGPYNLQRPCGLYETMLKKIIPYTVKGALWYQGESDCGARAKTYDILMTRMIDDWRKEWNDKFPFIFVQLAPFGKWLECTSDNYVEVREKQAYVADNYEGAYMCSIMDIGSYYDIHPKIKMEVGRRLALLARGHVYGETDLLCESPVIDTAAFDGKDTFTLSFKYAGSLKIGNDKTDIEIKADDALVDITNISSEGNKLIIKTEKASGNHFKISMGWADFAQIFIWNEQGLPIRPFTITI